MAPAGNFVRNHRLPTANQHGNGHTGKPPSLTVPAFLGITLTANIRVAPASRHVFKGAIITVRATEGSKKRHSTRDAMGDLAVLKATFRLRGRAICRAACHARMTASQCPRIRHT